MVEHRGVGLSRTDIAGHDLPADALTITATVDDIAAVLDDAGIDRAVIYGASYGSYLTQAFGALHPDRVAAMVLDSTMIDAENHVAVREHARSVLWEGLRPETVDIAQKLRALVDSNAATVEELSEAARITYEFGGETLLTRLLNQFAAGRANRTWRWLASLGRNDGDRVVRYIMEFDLVGVIAFRELNYAPEPDGGPFDPGIGFSDVAPRFPPYAGEPFDLPAHLPHFDWPVAVLTGSRDLRTPPSVAAKAVSLVPDGVLVPLTDTGHSALDTHQLAALEIIQIVRDGGHRTLSEESTRLSRLPRRGSSRHIATLIRASLATERINPLNPF